MNYWTWWQGSLALTATAMVYLVLTKRPLGVSGKLAKVIAWKESRALEAAAAQVDENPEAFDEAMLEATLEMIRNEMGEEAAEEYRAQMLAEQAAPSKQKEPPCVDGSPDRVPLEVHLAFLIGLFSGGLSASLGDGSLALRSALDPEFTRLVASGPQGLAVLFFGGILVGAGTAMAGGCTSGHGLTGVARLQPGSLAATAAFFGAGALASAWLAGGFGGAL